MRLVGEYISGLDAILREARSVGDQQLADTRRRDALDLLEFCIQCAHQGFVISASEFTRGRWLDPSRRGGPTTEADLASTFAIVLCCVGDPQLARDAGAPISGPRFAGYFRRDRVLALYEVDAFPLFDAACIFLHELRHARQHLAAPLGLPELEEPEAHEDRTWEFHCSLLAARGGTSWGALVERVAGEIAPILAAAEPPSDPFRLVYPRALDALFGPAAHPSAQVHRTALLGAAAVRKVSERTGTPLHGKYEELFSGITIR